MATIVVVMVVVVVVVVVVGLWRACVVVVVGGERREAGAVAEHAHLLLFEKGMELGVPRAKQTSNPEVKEGSG